MVCRAGRAMTTLAPDRRRAGHRALLLFACIVILLVTPSASGQNPTGPTYEIEATVTPHEDPVPPFISKGTATLRVVVTCTLPIVMAEHQDILLHMESSLESATAHLDVTTLTIDRMACLTLDSAHEAQVNATFSFPYTAPAFDDVEFRVHSTYDGEEQEIATWYERPGFHGSYEIQLENNLRQTVINQTSTFEGAISSLSNGPMVLELELLDPPKYGKLVYPDRFDIPYDRTTETQLTPFVMEYSRENHGTEELTILVTGYSTQDPATELDTSRINLRFVEPQTNLAEAPSPSLVVLAAGAMGLLFVLRRTR